METGTLLARYAVTLADGCLREYRRLEKDEACPAGAEDWFAYLETSDGVAWFNLWTKRLRGL